ncbi:unnamed protein product [Mytilus edulis]|uniref:Ig-like domain-containing protein n=1 Tax=Mytilus edulis TaxID=6550 RepID=A0A8S3RNF6_MYTED|nr:unnamed protein product [Mytilus edulis]
MFEKICLICLFLQEQSILTDSSITLYATEGSTINLTFINEHDENWLIDLFAITRNKDKRNLKLVNASRYDISTSTRIRISDNKYQQVTKGITGTDGTYDMERSIANQSMSAGSDITVYATAGSTSILTFQDIFRTKRCFKNGKQILLIKSKYHITMSKPVIEIKIANVTANDTGEYKVYDPLGFRPGLDLNVSHMSCHTRTTKQACAIEGSTAILPFITDWSLCHNDNEVDFVLRKNILKAGIIYLYLHVYNATSKDKGYYKCFPRIGQTVVLLKVAKLSFIGQTDIQTIVGQEGKEMTITCSSDNEEFITALKLETNGTVLALGDNQTVDFKLTPDRKYHLTRFKCEDVIQSSITIEVELIVTYAPEITIRHTNDTIVCDYIGVPAVYEVKRINHVSQYGTLLRSMNMNNEAFNLQTEFPYQKNGNYECVVSNGIRDNNGNIMQTVSTNVKYEGPPVFSPENRNVKYGEVGKSMKLSFHIYSYPPVKDIFMQQIGRKQSERKKISKVNMLTSILSYTEFANIEGIEGYEISVEYEIFDKDDFRSYCITAKNRLGENNYYFFIQDDDHSDQIDDELSSISFPATNNVSSSDTNNDHDQNSTQTRPSNISVGVNHQSTDESESFATSELPSNFQSTDAQEQRVSIPSSLSNVFNTDDSGILSIVNAENCNKINAIIINNALSNKNSETSMESDSESSDNVMVGSDGDGYENPYETISQEREESHQYIMMSKERHNSFSSIEYHCKDDRLETTNAKEATYINLQF